jgi:hypothetical protein
MGKRSPSTDVGPPLEGNPGFVGGLRLRPIFANWGSPGVKLTLCEEGIRIGPISIILRALVPVQTFRYDDLAEVQAIGISKWVQGIRFTSRSSGRWAIFWTFSRDQVLLTMSGFTDIVNDVPIRLNYWNPGPEKES